MARYYATLSHKNPNRSGKSTVSKCGHRTTGLITNCQAWDAGIEVIVEWDEEKKTDIFSIYLNKGSNDKNDLVLLLKTHTKEIQEKIDKYKHLIKG